MKKKLIGAAVLVLCGTAAHAQSSVTLYGVLDTGIAYTNNQGGSSAWQQASSLLSNTLFGLRGSEDLGGGLHTIFRLESGFNINNGKQYYANTMFGRQAYVGLQDDKYGTLTFGRQYDVGVDYLGSIAMSNTGEGNNLAAHPFDNDNLDDSFYINNAVKYTSPTFAGLQFEGLYGFSNQAGGFANNRAYSAGVSYSNGPINLAASYLEVDNAGGGPLGTNTNGAVSSNDNPYFISSRQRVAGVGGNYTFGSATVGLLWTHTMFDNVSAIAGTPLGLPGGAGLHMDNYEVNARYALTPALTLAGAYTFTDGRFTSEQGASDPKWNQVTLMTDYSLSKRTDIYLEGVYQHVSGAQAGSVLSDAMINGVSASSTGNQVLVTTGIRHSF